MGDKVAFLYAPVGWQRPDMGRRLYEREAVFREALDAANRKRGCLPKEVRTVSIEEAVMGFEGLKSDSDMRV